jgi:hypothetical protein
MWELIKLKVGEEDSFGARSSEKGRKASLPDVRFSAGSFRQGGFAQRWRSERPNYIRGTIRHIGIVSADPTTRLPPCHDKLSLFSVGDASRMTEKGRHNVCSRYPNSLQSFYKILAPWTYAGGFQSNGTTDPGAILMPQN